MKILFESDRECTIDGVGLLEPGEAVEVDPVLFELAHGVSPAQASFPYFIKVVYDLTEGGE